MKITAAKYNPQCSTAHIVDNRDNTREEVRALGRTVADAYATAFLSAAAEARLRNRREGWPRFVALRSLAK